MPEPKRARAEAALDDVSDHLGVVLQRADELLVQWSAFGASVRTQVEREASAIGDAVAGAVDTAVARAASAGVDRAIADQVGARLAALTSEIGRLEARTRAAARTITDERTGDRRVLWIVVAGIALANALLVAILLRRPTVVQVPAEPAKVEVAAPAGGAAPAEPAATTAPGSDEAPQAEAPSSSDPASENALRPEPPSPISALRPVAGPPGAASAPATVESAAPGMGGAAAGAASGSAAAPVAGANAAGVRAPAAKLPPRAYPHKR